MNIMKLRKQKTFIKKKKKKIGKIRPIENI